MTDEHIDFLSLPAQEQIVDYCANLHVDIQRAQTPDQTNKEEVWGLKFQLQSTLAPVCGM